MTPDTSPFVKKVSPLKTETYFCERLARGNLAGCDAWLAASPDVPPDIGDEMQDPLDHV